MLLLMCLSCFWCFCHCFSTFAKFFLLTAPCGFHPFWPPLSSIPRLLTDPPKCPCWRLSTHLICFLIVAYYLRFRFFSFTLLCKCLLFLTYHYHYYYNYILRFTHTHWLNYDTSWSSTSWICSFCSPSAAREIRKSVRKTFFLLKSFALLTIALHIGRPEREVVPQQLHDQCGVLIALFA